MHAQCAQVLQWYDNMKNVAEKIWGWDEDYQRNDFDGDFSHIKQFNVIEVDSKFVGFVQYYFESRSFYPKHGYQPCANDMMRKEL